jgi:hypothetical protein
MIGFALMIVKVTPSPGGSAQYSLTTLKVVLLPLIPQYFSSQCVRTVSVMLKFLAY